MSGMKHLYELTQEMEALMDSDDDVSEQDMMVVFGDIQKKAGNICQFVTVLESEVNIYKAEEERLAVRRKAIENKAKSIKEYLKVNMQHLGIEKLNAGTFKIALQNSPPSLVVEDEAAVDADFIDIIPARKEVNKARLKEALKNGRECHGARLEQSQHVRIR